MAVRRKYYSIYQLARAWSFNRINIMLLIISGELKTSILLNDGNFVACDNFSDIPNDLRENLKVIRTKRVPKDKLKELLQPWDQVYITAEEVDRYAENNLHKDSMPTPVAINDDNDNPKKIRSLLILVATMAIKNYKYQPREAKSDVPAKIAASAATLGLSINEKTVREWLKKAVDLIDGDKY